MTRKLGRYELVELLGQGGMGEVWLARISGAGGFEKPCIVKMVLPALVKDRQFVERFLHEGKVLVHLSHSNIAQVYDMRDEEGVLYMALEYVAGVDVWQLMSMLEQQQELIPIPVALFIAWQAAEGLSYAHHKAAPDGSALAIVHRDVSPQNVMVSYEGEIKVIDFGIARSAARSHATQAATVLGKLGYMSPEQATAGEVDARADQFALGVLLWELLTGRRFVRAATTPEMMVAMTRPPLQPLPPLRSEVDAALDAVVQKALSPSPGDRYPTTDDFGRALLSELARLGGPPSKRQVGEWVKLKCGDAWTANQRLMSKISTLERTGEPTTPQFPPEQLAETLAKAKPIPLVTPVAEPRERSSSAPLIVALAALLLAGVTAVWLVTRPAQSTPLKGDPPAPVAAADAAALPPSYAVVSTVDAGPIAVAVAPTFDAGPAAATARPTPLPIKARLSVSVSEVATPKRAVRLKNTGGGAMTGCWITIPGQLKVELQSLPPGFEREFVLDQFKPVASAAKLNDEVRIDCAQGSVTVPIR